MTGIHGLLFIESISKKVFTGLITSFFFAGEAGVPLGLSVIGSSSVGNDSEILFFSPK